MYCPFCGGEYSQGSKHCPSCGALLDNRNGNTSGNDSFNNSNYNSNYSGYDNNNNNYNNNNYNYNNGQPQMYASDINNGGQIAFSIINLICCNLVFGIIALVLAATAKNASSYEDAENKLRVAKILNIVGVVLTAVIYTIYLIVVLSGGTAFWDNYLLR